jgi:hypothetical protein
MKTFFCSLIFVMAVALNKVVSFFIFVTTDENYVVFSCHVCFLFLFLAFCCCIQLYNIRSSVVITHRARNKANSPNRLTN